ncbi:MAG TPA: response regulator [Gemmatimonadales bacterium]|jgi:signal transduction histidine kinase/ActR/RegA family two-component response regulator|nr:response regulator [Gemmatimonadales bacterium]
MLARGAAPRDDTILIFAPTGRDPELIARMLAGLQLTPRALPSIGELCAEIGSGAGIVILAEEALTPESALRLVETIEAQPSWSDIPVLLLTTAVAIARTSQPVLEALRQRANVTLLERPVHPLTLISAVQSALRARRRQYDVRDYLADRQRSEERVRQAQKMDAVGKLAGGVAHEVNNMMTAVIGFADYALKQLPADHPVRPDIEEVIKAGTRAAAVTQQLLAFSRRQPHQPSLLSLQEVIPELSKLLERLLGAEHELRLEVPRDLPPVLADRNQLEQVLVNLALNARDAMEPGGRLVIAGSIVEIDDGTPPSSVVEIRTGRYVRIRVTDTGQGMSPEAREHAFEPFYTTKPLGQGTGLGLSTVYGIIKQSGGYVWIDSRLGEGTTITVDLPAVSEALPAPAERAPGPSRGRETVLVVEDEPLVRRLARRALEEHGYTVLEAADGREAIAELASGEHPIGLVLSDLVMPRMSGRELGQEIARRYPGLPVLFMSGYTGEDVRSRGLLEGSAPFVQKPFTADALARRVRTMLDGNPAGDAAALTGSC